MAVDFTKGHGPLAVTMRVMDSKQNNVSFVLFFAKSHGYVLSNYKNGRLYTIGCVNLYTYQRAN